MLPQNPVIQPEKIDYGEVALKVPKPRKSDRLQRKSEQPLNPARSFYKQIRKKLSCPATQIRIFLSVVLIFGTVLTIGYVMNSETLEHGANRNLKENGFMSKVGGFFGNFWGGNQQGSKKEPVPAEPDTASEARLKIRKPNSRRNSTAMVKYDAGQNTIDIRNDKFTTKFTTDDDTWLSPGSSKKGDARYDALVDVLNTNNNNRETLYLKTVKKRKGEESGKKLMDALKEGFSSTVKPTIKLNDILNKFGCRQNENRGTSYGKMVVENGHHHTWKVKVHNKELHDLFSEQKGQQTFRAEGKIIKGKQKNSQTTIGSSDTELSCEVPVSPAQRKGSFDIIVEFSGCSEGEKTFKCQKTGSGWMC